MSLPEGRMSHLLPLAVVDQTGDDEAGGVAREAGRMRRSTTVALLVLSAAVVALVVVVAVNAMSTTDTDGPAERPECKSKSAPYRFAAVATDSGICSQVGNEMLARHGGSAVDAAIASLLCIGVVNAQHAGIGGGVIMMIYERAKGDDEKTLVSLIGRETAPLSAHAHMFDSDPDSQSEGVASIAVPGELNGYHEAWKKYGRVPWRTLFEPAIALCRNGWLVTESMATSILAAKNEIMKYQNLRQTFTKPDGSLYEAGDTITNEKLGRTLEVISTAGGDTFYSGSLADDIIADVRDAGGNMTKADLASNAALLSAPLITRLMTGGYEVATAPPPSSGAVIQLILAVMDGYNITAADLSTSEWRTMLLHRLIEAWKFGDAWRDKLGDMQFADDSLREHLSKWNSSRLVHQIRSRIRDDAVGDAHMYTSYSDVEGTTHVSIVTSDGAAVSATSTVGRIFGSCVIGPRTGIIFNNGMNLFDLPTANKPVSANHVAPRKRGLSSTSPLLVFDKSGNLALVIGASGGSRIITASTYVIIQNLWLGTNITASVDEPRLHSQLQPDTLYYDKEFPKDQLEALVKMGHQDVARADTKYPYLAVVQAVDVQNQTVCQREGTHAKCLYAVSDFRKGGYPDGY